MDSAERELFARSVRAAFESGADLAELGWTDALAADARAAVSILFETQGRVAKTSPALDDLDERVGRLAVAHELVGASKAMLDLARQHALEREQFGRPIAGFQAVRHRLADALIAIETAVAMLEDAWDDGGAEFAAVAKAVAGRSAKTTARHCQQVLAGIGFTAEHPFHLYFKRILVLDQLLGSSKSLTRDLGAEILRTNQLPRLLPL